MTVTMRDMMPLTRSRRQVKQEAKLGSTIFEHVENYRSRLPKTTRTRQIGSSGYITYKPAGR
jgi:hypothetical protein